MFKRKLTHMLSGVTAGLLGLGMVLAGDGPPMASTFAPPVPPTATVMEPANPPRAKVTTPPTMPMAPATPVEFDLEEG